MVTAITAYQDNDGRIHKDQKRAEEANDAW